MCHAHNDQTSLLRSIRHHQLLPMAILAISQRADRLQLNGCRIERDFRQLSGDFRLDDLNGVGHMILANHTNSAQSLTFSLSGMSYTPTVVRNYFTNEVVAPISNNSFSVTLPASGVGSGTAVYKLSAS